MKVVLLWAAISLAIGAAIIFLVYVIDERKKYKTIRVVMDEEDNDAFFKVMKVLKERIVEGMTYDDTTDVIIMDMKVPPKKFEEVYKQLDAIPRVEVMEVR